MLTSPKSGFSRKGVGVVSVIGMGFYPAWLSLSELESVILLDLNLQQFYNTPHRIGTTIFYSGNSRDHYFFNRKSKYQAVHSKQLIGFPPLLSFE
ncbi:hypothetical protein QCA50_020307 [Cerrena zonata]|uniref:Uncharacterized protein n=1 Tax=Cerrena zonata TaxID=2478898 RepID=A0AAW0F9Q7_9APHY